MSQTIDAIQDKLSPETLKEQAKEAVKEATVGKVQDKVSSAAQSVTDAVSNVTHSVTDAVSGGGGGRDTGDYVRYKSSGLIDKVRENPIPAAMVGVGLAWLLKSSRRDVGSQPYYYHPVRGRLGYGEPASPVFTERYDQIQPRQQYGQYGSGQQGSGEGMTSTLQSAAGTVQETAGQAAHQAREQVGHVAEQAGEMTHQAREQIGQVPQMARTQAQDLRYWFNRQSNQNPMMLGVAALGLGTLVGLLVPETERESQLMGEKRDQLVDRAQSMAQETVQKVQTVAQDVGTAVQETAQESAQQQGLTGS